MANHDLAEVSTCYTLTWRWGSRHSADRIWRAISDPGEVSAWMGYPVEVDLKVGGRFFVSFERTDEGTIDGTIVEVIPLTVMAYAWGMSIVRWELASTTEQGCRITFVHHGLDRAAAKGLGAGWHEFLDQFGDYLEGAAPADHATRTRRHDELTGDYEKSVEVATTGSPK
jgi:uncharacterized protein YndB with AHSA1/START domain